MSLRLADAAEADEWLDEWPLAGRPRYMLSPAYGLVHRELERYVQGEIPGRSFLIAGHRGAGKTALVQRAVEDVARTVLRSDGAQGARSSTRLLGLQRPLLVKLYGPSLLGSGPDSAVPAPPAAQGALVQITIALYRALAAEVAEAYAIHAREARPRLAGALELSGQLVLELDQVPDPVTLRAFWTRLGRLGRGVIWPEAIAAALQNGGLVDQGVREIVAVATAAQAYQVCAGDVRDQQTRKEEASREASVEARGTDLRPLAHGITAGTAGALAGLGVAAAGGGIAGPAAAAAGTALLGLAALSWNAKRSRRSQRAAEYTFIRDHSVQTLERDVPLMIERIRRAGLAPVFLVDELDKLDQPQESIGELIRRLKHLTTDYGFFCFLTDRDYFEYVRRKLQTEAYPLEHTYFSDRLFVLPRPLQFVAHLRSLVEVRDTASPRDEQQHGVVRSMLARIVVHRSRLNMIDAIRGLAASFEAADGANLDIQLIAPRLRNRLAFTVQVAIELLLQDREVVIRLGDDPMFAQLAVDTLYRISRSWEAEEKTIDLRKGALIAYLLQRLRQKADDDDELDEKALNRATGGVKIALLVQLMERLRDYLLDFASLAADADGKWQLDADDAPYRTDLIRIMPLDVMPRLLQPTDDAGVYGFTYDAFGGQNLEGGRELIEEAGRLLRLLQAFEDLMTKAELSIADAINVGMWSATVPVQEVGDSINRMETVVEKPAAEDGTMDAETLGFLARTLPAYRAAASAIRERLDVFPTVIPFLRTLQVDIDATGPPPMRDIIPRLARVIDLPAICAQPQPVAALRAVLPDVDAHVPLIDPPLAEAEALRRWAEQLEERIQARRERVPAREILPTRISLLPRPVVWERWRRRILAWFDNARGLPLVYEDALLAAADIAPGSLFRRDLGSMTARQWSAVVLHCLPATEPAIQMCAALALRALGYGHDLVAKVGAPDLPGEQAGTAPDRPGVLLVCLDTDSVADDPDYRSEVPLVAVTEAELERFANELDRLTDLGAFGARANERQTAEPIAGQAGGAPVA